MYFSSSHETFLFLYSLSVTLYLYHFVVGFFFRSRFCSFLPCRFESNLSRFPFLPHLASLFFYVLAESSTTTASLSNPLFPNLPRLKPILATARFYFFSLSCLFSRVTNREDYFISLICNNRGQAVVNRKKPRVDEKRITVDRKGTKWLLRRFHLYRRVVSIYLTSSVQRESVRTCSEKRPDVSRSVTESHLLHLFKLSL